MAGARLLVPRVSGPESRAKVGGAPKGPLSRLGVGKGQCCQFRQAWTVTETVLRTIQGDEGRMNYKCS